MLDLKLFDETLARLRRLADQNQESATFVLNLGHDMYELPSVPGKGRQLIPGDQVQNGSAQSSPVIEQPIQLNWVYGSGLKYKYPYGTPQCQ